MKLNSTNRNLALLGLLLTTLLTVVGCRNQLVFATDTKFGLDVSQQADQQPEVSLGYSRAELVSIPAASTNELQASGTPLRDAGPSNDTYSVVGVFAVHSRFARSVHVSQCFATGVAARMAGTNSYLSAFYGSQMAEIANLSTNAPK